jgi:hypothetical protein
LNDYKKSFGHEEPKPLGGLGPTMSNPEWNDKSKKRENMINFAKEAEFGNKIRLAGIKPALKAALKKKRFGVDGPQWEME